MTTMRTLDRNINIRCAQDDVDASKQLADRAGVDASTAVRGAIAFALRHFWLFKLWLRK